ncbi:hypothetical protein AN403_5620 [Pseudomonas fluorescens]|uniref:Uncharacterized protein n=1 Tax=Pseudomonas fluorescens TaxID=294 RepID=A0A0P8X610_PSEFL|nr:hypothetical protein AN403_5620 [Pseudomonas fluorescens]
MVDGGGQATGDFVLSSATSRSAWPMTIRVHWLPMVLCLPGPSPAVHRQAVCGLVGYAGEQAT